ncbi:hypothetical protein HHI36_014135 [Cryptolaemus montrouzieri]|uniref:Nuclear condensin complex subunit 3 C-terminal domain-containing protein n=1 Tax=Cryptolaemus montrouzieri TaxID=559131 RepID=A0ABD2N1W7_9CUCU
MKQVEKSFDVSNLELFLNVYSKTLYKLYFTDFADKNHFVARGLEFLAKLAVKITLNCVEPLDVTNPNGTVSRVYDITTDPFFTHLLKCSLKYSSVEKTEIRFNTCYFVQTLLQNIGNNVEMDNSLCNSILESLLELLHDPKVNVRLQALKALVRLQEPGNPECVVLKSFMLLFTDVNSEVRKAVVKHIAPHPQSYAKIRERLTDTDVGVRQAAYTKWADINPRLFLKIVDRNFILTCAFSDSNKKIQNILNEKLLPKWLISYGGNHLDLLKALKLDADENDLKNFENLCVQVMNVFLKSNSLSEILKHLPVNKENKLIPVKQLHLESVLYWLILISYLRKIEDGEDYLDKILPELTPFSNYIERIIKEKSASSMDEWENLEYQNIVYHLFRIASGFDMSDEVGRRTFYSIILQILTTHKFQQKVIDEIISVASLLNHNIDTFTTDLCQVISEIREPLVDEVPSESEVRARNFEMSKIKVKIQALEMAEEEASKNKDFQHANIIHLELVECQRQLENLKNLSSDKVRVSKDDPETLCRCLDMLIGVLKMGKIKSMTPALRTCKDEFLMPILGCNVSEVHWRFISCLGLFSLMDEETAFTHANLISLPIATYKAVPNYDKAALKTSVACVTDLIRVYGVKVVGIEEPDSDMALEQTQSTTRRKLYSQDMEELRVVSKDDISIEFIIDIILDMLDDEDEDVRFTAVSSIARLMADNFPVNPELISRLILKWFNPLTERKDTMLQQQVGVIIKCFLDNSKGAKKILEKSVMSIISSIANAPISSPLVEVDIDNVLRFLSALTNSQDSIESENIHNSLAFSIIEKISNKPNDVCTPPLAKLLTYLEVQFEDPVSKRNLISSAELLLMDVIDKGPNRNIFKFIKN